MTRNPFINALAAFGYIAAIILVLFYGPIVDGELDNTVLLPITMLSLFVFSAASMAYIFLYQPVVLVIDGKQKEAVSLFLSTLGIFGTILAALVISILVISRLG